MTKKICVIALITGLAMAEADDWNQWGGPNRNFHVSSIGLNVSWGPDGPERLWSRALGEGYSSIVASSDRLFTMYRDDETEVVVSLDAATGETRWEHRYNASLKEDMNYGTWLRQGGAGPYSTPLLLSGVLYAVGVTGKFHAFDASSRSSGLTTSTKCSTCRDIAVSHRALSPMVATPFFPSVVVDRRW